MSNPVSIESPEDVEFRDFYQIDLYNSQDHLEFSNINLYLSNNQYTKEELEKLQVFQFSFENASWYQINATFFLDEMKFLILDTEIDEITIYAIGKMDENNDPNEFAIPGFTIEFLSMFILIGVFLIIKKKSFMNVDKNV